LASWIDAFVGHTDNLDAPVAFRRWVAISVIGSVLEQKVWLKTGKGVLYPNLYVTLVGAPGLNKTVTIRKARQYLHEISDFHLAPTSMTAASMVDVLVESKRMLVQLPHPPLEYNCMSLIVDEMGTFISKYDDEMIAILSAFYDPDPYGQTRRGKDIKIKINSPQLNILCGTTPSNLMNFMPEGAWDQGFTSRMIFVFSDERILGDDFADTTRDISRDLIHDLKVINSQVGEFKVTEDYRNLVNLWREGGEHPQPTHPKLVHYNTRRRAHFYKLSIISALDRADALVLDREDFNRAMNWLVSNEVFMEDIFKSGGASIDSQAMDQLYHLVLKRGDEGVGEQSLHNEARKLVPANTVERLVILMQQAGMITAYAVEKKTGLRRFRAVT